MEKVIDEQDTKTKSSVSAFENDRDLIAQHPVAGN
jgi:hypothetical protein